MFMIHCVMYNFLGEIKLSVSVSGASWCFRVLTYTYSLV